MNQKPELTKNSISSSKILTLDLWEEIDGVLEDYYIDNKNGNLILQIRDLKNVRIPFNENFVKNLDGCKGQKVEILRTDLPDKPFIIRHIKKRL